jgi:transcription elongation factor Elf1
MATRFTCVDCLGEARLVEDDVGNKFILCKRCGYAHPAREEYVNERAAVR